MPKSVLKTLKNVPLFQCEIYNDNTRFYPSEIVTKKILNPRVKNEMEIGMLLGEIDHPEKRFTTNAEFVSHAITSMIYNENNHTLYGDIDILDTPRGRILKTLSDYGAIGFSARAMGKSKPTKEGEIIDVDSYYFKTFDAVVTPGFSIARDFNESGESENNLKVELTNLYETFSDEDKFKVRNIYEKLDLIEKSDYKKKYNEDLYTSSITTSTSLLDRIKDANLELPLSSSELNENENLVNEGTNTMSTEEVTQESEIESYKLEIELNEEVIDDLNKQLLFSQQINEALKNKTSKMQESINILQEALEGKEKIYSQNISTYKNMIESLQNELTILQESIVIEDTTKDSKVEDDELVNETLTQDKKGFTKDIEVISAVKQNTLNETKKLEEDELTALLYKNLK